MAKRENQAIVLQDEADMIVAEANEKAPNTVGWGLLGLICGAAIGGPIGGVLGALAGSLIGASIDETK